MESAIHRWVARLLAQRIDVLSAEMRIERVGRRRTTARLELMLPDGLAPSASVAHADPYVAIAEAFRSARRQALECPARPHAYARAG